MGQTKVYRARQKEIYVIDNQAELIAVAKNDNIGGSQKRDKKIE